MGMRLRNKYEQVDEEGRSKKKRKNRKKVKVEVNPKEEPREVPLPLHVNNEALVLLHKHKALLPWFEVEHNVKIKLPRVEAAPILVTGLPLDAEVVVGRITAFITEQTRPKPVRVPYKVGHLVGDPL